jgi:hypothetical protein
MEAIMFGLGHMDLGPLVYGIVIGCGLLIIRWKWRNGFMWSAFVDVFVFVLVFKLHGGTMAGGFAATIAALFVSLIIAPPIRRRKT